MVTQPGGSTDRAEQIAIVNLAFIANMDILEKQGIKIPNAVLIKHVTHDDTDDEVVAFFNQYGKLSNIKVIIEPGVFQDTIVVEFDSGNALVKSRKILPYTYICQTEKVTYDILELSTVCADFFGELKTQKYLGELAKLTGQDYSGVLNLREVIHQLETGEKVPSMVRKELPDLGLLLRERNYLELQDEGGRMEDIYRSSLCY